MISYQYFKLIALFGNTDLRLDKCLPLIHWYPMRDIFLIIFEFNVILY